MNQSLEDWVVCWFLELIINCILYHVVYNQLLYHEIDSQLLYHEVYNQSLLRDFIFKQSLMLSGLKSFHRNLATTYIKRNMTQLVDQMNAAWEKGLKAKELVVFQSELRYIQDHNYNVLHIV